MLCTTFAFDMTNTASAFGLMVQAIRQANQIWTTGLPRIHDNSIGIGSENIRHDLFASGLPPEMDRHGPIPDPVVTSTTFLKARATCNMPIVGVPCTQILDGGLLRIVLRRLQILISVDQLWPTTFRMAAILSTRPFLGKSLSRSPDRVESVLAFAVTLSNAVGSLRVLPLLFRYLFEERLPRVKALVQARDRCEEMMMPLIDQHLRRWRADGGHPVPARNIKTDSDGGGLLDFIVPQYTELNPRKLTRDEITVILESMLNLSSGLSHVLYNIARYRDTYADDLRIEYLEATAEDGKLTKDAMFRMKKMDSFLKETQRINPPALSEQQLDLSHLTDFSLPVAMQ
ncbi:hypothetical protein LTR28_005322 [Elasticomyces elasticus]|nr:hypothetical protein LTR28_005322 [Elasticomyces elasticus]